MGNIMGSVGLSDPKFFMDETETVRIYRKSLDQCISVDKFFLKMG